MLVDELCPRRQPLGDCWRGGTGFLSLRCDAERDVRNPYSRRAKSHGHVLMPRSTQAPEEQRAHLLKRQIRRHAAIIEWFGFTNPASVDGNYGSSRAACSAYRDRNDSCQVPKPMPGWFPPLLATRVCVRIQEQQTTALQEFAARKAGGAIRTFCVVRAPIPFCARRWYGAVGDAPNEKAYRTSSGCDFRRHCARRLRA